MTAAAMPNPKSNAKEHKELVTDATPQKHVVSPSFEKSEVHSVFKALIYLD
jgi:hypothetical protein